MNYRHPTDQGQKIDKVNTLNRTVLEFPIELLYVVIQLKLKMNHCWTRILNNLKIKKGNTALNYLL